MAKEITPGGQAEKLALQKLEVAEGKLKLIEKNLGPEKLARLENLNQRRLEREKVNELIADMTPRREWATTIDIINRERRTKAINKARLVGKGEKGKDGKSAEIGFDADNKLVGNFTQAQLKENIKF